MSERPSIEMNQTARISLHTVKFSKSAGGKLTRLANLAGVPRSPRPGGDRSEALGPGAKRDIGGVRESRKRKSSRHDVFAKTPAPRCGTGAEPADPAVRFRCGAPAGASRFREERRPCRPARCGRAT
jgi:hypothetical protein